MPSLARSASRAPAVRQLSPSLRRSAKLPRLRVGRHPQSQASRTQFTAQPLDDRPAPWHPCFDVRVSHNVRMAPAYDFKLALTRLIEPTGGPGIELGTLEDVRWSNKTMAPGAAALVFCG